MTLEEKNQIIALRDNGYSYGQIAEATNLSRNTVVSIIRRLSSSDEELKITKLCLRCGKPLKMIAGHKEKKFCCDKCRKGWWKKNRYHRGGSND